MDLFSNPGLNRRELFARATAIGAAALLGLEHRPAAADQVPETRSVRFAHSPSICVAPQYLAGDLLRMEGFSDVKYLALGTRAGPDALADGRLDMTMWFTTGYVPLLDAGKPIVLLAGIHLGC